MLQSVFNNMNTKELLHADAFMIRDLICLVEIITQTARINHAGIKDFKLRS